MVPSFQNPSLFETALIHRSALNETGAPISNERLEFLGDAVLELITTRWLYDRFPDEQEGTLTSYRAALVKTTTLASVAKELGLDAQLKMSRGEERSGGRENQGLLADTLEAVIGALYLDQGLDSVREFLETNLFPHFDNILREQTYKDYKTTLQELVQSKGSSTPLYRTVGETGPDHQKTFSIEVIVDGSVIGAGIGKSKQDASQDAARDALEKIQ